MNNKVKYQTDISKLTRAQLLDASALIATLMRNDVFKHDWTGVRISNADSFYSFVSRTNDASILSAIDTLKQIGDAIKKKP